MLAKNENRPTLVSWGEIFDNIITTWDD